MNQERLNSLWQVNEEVDIESSLASSYIDAEGVSIAILVRDNAMQAMIVDTYLVPMTCYPI